jgi:hypothetical protein
MKRNSLIFILAAVLGMVSIVAAATLSYSPAAPQTGDSALVIANKAAVASTTTAAQTTAAASALAVQNAGNSFANITTATTTAVKASAGVLVRVIVGTAGAGSTLTIYNNTGAGTDAPIATMTTAAQGSFEFNVTCSAGIKVVSASGTPANITVVYR